jgi:hypothetical protein
MGNRESLKADKDGRLSVPLRQETPIFVVVEKP